MLDAGDVRRLTDSPTLPRTVEPLTWEHFAVPTHRRHRRDRRVDHAAGRLRPGETYPVLLNVHGGPHTQYGETFFDEAQLQAAAGFVVLM